MKKLFVSALAILGLVACAKDDVVSVQDNRSAIGFDTFVENVTRVGYTTDNLDGFDVWAYMGDTRILNDEDVEKVNGVYTYGNTQYWIPGQDYFFAALAPLNLVNVTDASNEGLGEITFTNVDGTEDLIYSTYSVTADGSQDKVNFQFNHLLSKVKFSFVNAFDNANYAFTVENIKMTAPESAFIDLTAGAYSWGGHTGEITLDFGVTQTEPASKGNTFSSDDLLTIPAGDTQVYNVTFDVNLYVAGTLARTYNKEAKIKGIEFVAGKGYSLTATINADTFNLEDIDFDATVEDWDESVPAYEPYKVEVNGVSYDDLTEACEVAMNSGYPVNFFQHVVVDADNTITVEAGKTLTLNLNGYTLTGVTSDADKNDDGALTSFDNEVMFDVRGTMNVNGGTPISRASAAENGTISVKHIDTNFEWNACTEIFYIGFGGTLNVENTTLENLGGSDMAYAIDMVNATDGITLKVENSTIKSTYIPVRVFNNGSGMNNVEIKNSTLKGGSRAFWVHIYTKADDSSFFANGKDINGNNYKDETLNINIYNPTCNNTFIANDPNRIIEYGFTNEINFDAYGTLLIVDADGLQAALDAAPANATTIIALGANIEGDVTDIQKPGRKVEIEGRNYKYNGTIKVHSNSEHYADAALTIKNVKFETSSTHLDKDGDPYFNFIEALENGSERYSCNITVEDCTFTATGEAVNTAVGVQIKASKNAKVIGCTATNMHSLIQAQSCDESVLVQNCTVNGKNGVAFKQVKAATVEGTTITALEYGIRFDGNIDNYGITVKNNNVTAAQPFIVRKMTGKDNTITLEGTNTLTTDAEYQIVVTNGSDDEAYVKPTGTYTLTGADNYDIFPAPYPVASWDEFTTALAAGETDIKLTADIEYASNYQLQKSVILNLGGYSMTLPMINIHTKTTIKNGTINGKVYARKNSEIVFNNVKFSGAVADNLSTEGHLAIQGGCKSLYAKDCLFSPTSVSGSQTKPLSFEGGSTIMKFEGCEFKSSPYKKQVYFNSLSATGSLDFTNCNFNNKTPNIMFAAACPLTNLTMSGTTKLGSVTLETNRAKEAVTAEDLAYIRESLIANNSMSSVRLFYAGGSSEYIR